MLQLPISSLKSAVPVLHNSVNRERAVPLTYDQFRHSFANAVSAGPHRPVGDRQRSYEQQQDNPGVTEIEKIPGRGHALIIDSGWREVADKALTFVKRFT